MVLAFVVGVPCCHSLCQATFCTSGARCWSYHWSALLWSSCKHWPNFWVVLNGLGCNLVMPWVLGCPWWAQVTDVGHTSAWCSQCLVGTWNLLHWRLVQTRFTSCWILCDSDSKFLCLCLKFFCRPGLSMYPSILTVASQSMRFSVCLALPSCGLSRGLRGNDFSILLQLGAKKWVFSWPLPYQVQLPPPYPPYLPQPHLSCSKSICCWKCSADFLSLCLNFGLLHFLLLGWQRCPKPR